MPTEEEFLKYKPKRLDFEWYEEEGFVRLKVPKFKSNIGQSFCKLIKKDNKFVANFDELGSIVWRNCNGKNTVKQILEKVKNKFPEEKNIDQRLFLFLQQMKSLSYIDL